MYPEPHIMILFFILMVVTDCLGNHQETIHFQAANTSLMRDPVSGLHFALLNKHQHKYLNVKPFLVLLVKSEKNCELACVGNHQCFSFNLKVKQNPINEGTLRCELLSTDMFNSSQHLTNDANFIHFSIKSSCYPTPCKNGGTCIPFYKNNTHECHCASPYYGEECEKEITCESKTFEENERNGIHNVTDINGDTLQVYQDMINSSDGWTLIARLSNKDEINWIKAGGSWWYDISVPQGSTTNTTANQDMISPAFWSVKGTELKLTRSDDSCHIPLLQTTSNCLGSLTFRSMISSYGNFRNNPWQNSNCRGSCNVIYCGKYLSTSGFSQASCNGSFQNSDKIGFWCGGSGGFLDGAVMMIGGGGDGCYRADHGIAVTETDNAIFGNGCDFGDDSSCSNTIQYAVNLWIR